MNDQALSRDEAKSRLNSCFEEGTVSYTQHFREELLNDDLSMVDVLTVCKSGAVVMQPEKDIKTGQWKYRIEGQTLDRRNVAIVFTFRTPRAVMITVFVR